MLKKNDIIENHINSLLLAAAIVELFPRVLLVEGRGTEVCFFYDVFFPFNFESSLLGVIEDRMRIIHKEDRPLRSLEVTPNNAALWMEHQKQYLMAKKIKELSEPLIVIGQVGEFAAWIPYPIPNKTKDLFTAKLQEGFAICSSIPNLVRIVGVADNSCKQKRFFWKKKNHLQLICDMQLFMHLENQQAWVWLPKAELIKEHLIRWLKKEFIKEKIQLVACPYLLAGSKDSTSITAYHREIYLRSQKKMNKIAEISLNINAKPNESYQGLFQTPFFLADYAHLFCIKEDLLKECISSLQFIVKIPKILGFDFEIVLLCSHGKIRKKNSIHLSIMQIALKELGLSYRIEKKEHSNFKEHVEVHIADSLGRWWRGPFLSILKDEGESVLLRSAFGNLERIIGLLLEKTGGDLPFWLANKDVNICK